MADVDSLAEKARKGELVVFLGMDAPRTITGRPTAQELALGLGQRWKPGSYGTLVEAAGGLQQWQIRAYLAEQLPAGSSPGELHKAMAKLPVPFLVTAAYDAPLAQALEREEREANILIEDRDVDRRRLGRPNLIKMAGDLHRPATLAVSENQMQAMPDARRTRLYNLLRGWLAEKSLLLVGCDPSENGDFVIRLLPLLTGRRKSFRNPAFLIWPSPDNAGLSQAVLDTWQSRNVTILPGDPLVLLKELENKLSAGKLAFADDPEMVALRGFLNMLGSAPSVSRVEKQRRRVPPNQWLTSVRVTLGLDLSPERALLVSLEVAFDPDMDHFASRQPINSGISLAKLSGWARRAEGARASGAPLSGARWRSVENSGLEFMQKMLPKGSAERRRYLHALYLRRTFADSLTIVVEPRDSRLSPIPWELLHDGGLDWDGKVRGRGFLGLNYPLYRRCEAVFSPRQVAGRLERALLVAADPFGQLSGELKSEVEWLRQELVEKGGLSQVDVLSPDHPDISRPEMVRSLLRDGSYQLLHFTGHGVHDRDDPERSRLLLGRNGERNKLLTAASLAQVSQSNELVLVFLSACNVGLTEETLPSRPWQEAGVVDALTSAGVPATVGMQWVVGTENARLLVTRFYEELAQGKPIERALMIARQDLAARDESLVDWANPILTKRHGVLS